MENNETITNTEEIKNTEEKPKKKRKKLKIFLIIALVFVMLVAGLAIWQWNNIVALYYSIRYSEEELLKKEEENKKALDEAINTLNIEPPRELTKEEIAALENGEISKEEAINISLGITTLEGENNAVTPEQDNNSQAETGVETNAQNNTPAVTTPNVQPGSNVSNQPPKKASRLEELVAELYVLKGTYISKLNGLEAKAKQEYSATPKEQRTVSWKTSAFARYSKEATAWEAECDVKVEGIISKIKAELNRTGGDTSVIKKIRETYDTEKQIKKAQYLNKYK